MKQFNSFEKKLMKSLIKESLQFKGKTGKNPVVGAAVVKNNEIISTGFHEYEGGHHAEVNAINNASFTKDCDLYITLEPCTHHGKTPPCVDKIKEHQFKNIIFAAHDPSQKVKLNPAINILKNYNVYAGLCETDAILANDIFFKNQLESKPLVHCKVGVSLDGYMALENYQSKYITNNKAQKYAHQLRAHYDAILVGANTILNDRPKLTLRHNFTKLGFTDPKIIIFDPKNLLTNDDLKFYPKSTILIRQHRATISEAYHTIICDTDSIHWHAILTELYNLEVNSILLEGGGKTISLLYEQNEIDKLSYIIAPSIVGGHLGIRPFNHTTSVESLDKLMAVQHIKTTKFQDNVLIEGYIKDVSLWKI